MGVLGWMRRRRRASRTAPVATNAPPEVRNEKAEPPKPLDKQADEARAQVHVHSHLAG